MSAFSHTDWTVVCDYAGPVHNCTASWRTDLMDPPRGKSYPDTSDVRRLLKAEGWLTAIGQPAGEYRRRDHRLDFCPEHKDSEQARAALAASGKGRE